MRFCYTNQRLNGATSLTALKQATAHSLVGVLGGIAVTGIIGETLAEQRLAYGIMLAQDQTQLRERP